METPTPYFARIGTMNRDGAVVGQAVPAVFAGVSPATNPGARRPGGRRERCPAGDRRGARLNAPGKMHRGRDVKRREYAAVDRDEVRRELDCHWGIRGEGEFLFDFREVPVLRDGIRPHALITFNKKV